MQFLINTLTHWEEAPRARHHVALTLANNHSVVFVAANKPGLPKLTTRMVHNNIQLIVPYFPVIHKIRYRIPVINKIYQRWLFKKLNEKYGHYQVINFDFTATEIFSYFQKVCYYCNDSFAAISRHINPKPVARYHAKCEAKVASHSAFCIGVSDLLTENLLRFNANSFMIPLGSPDIHNMHIHVNEDPGTGKHHITVGLMGFIKLYNISVNAINNLLKDDQIQITLIGPVEDKFYELIENKEKVTLKGTLTGGDLYTEMNHFDVGIAPYSRRLTEDPKSGVGTGSKMYHYFSVGKPVVISAMAGLQKVNLPDGFLYVATSDDEFLQLVKKAWKENTREKIRERAEYARNNSWGKRMEEFLDYVERFGNKT